MSSIWETDTGHRWAAELLLNVRKVAAALERIADVLEANDKKEES